MKALLCKLFGWYCATQPNPVPVAPILNPIKEEPKAPISNEISTDQIYSIVMQNGCKDIYWKDRGKAPIGYVVGMAKTYAQAKCDKFLAEKLTRPVTSSKDALMKYGLKPTLPNVFAFLTGLGMRESSGKACTGRDLSASFTEAWSAESGAFQTSLDSKNYAPYLEPFFKNWKKECFADDFLKGISCNPYDAKIWGSDKTQYGRDGILFQIRSKSCPSFQAEYSALVMRENLNHYGPIKRMEVQFQKSCVALFESIDAVIQCK